ncbi:MAG: hypothetical protein V4684_02115 [Pseudomonadota bacterium]
MPVSDTQHLEKLRTYWKQHHAFPAMAKLCEVVGLAPPPASSTWSPG